MARKFFFVYIPEEEKYVSKLVNGHFFLTAKRSEAVAVPSNKTGRYLTLLTLSNRKAELVDVIMGEDGAYAPDSNTREAELSEVYEYEREAMETIRTNGDVKRAYIANCTHCPLEECVLDEDEPDSVYSCSRLNAELETLAVDDRDGEADICHNCSACSCHTVCKTAQMSYVSSGLSKGCRRYAGRVLALNRVAKAKGLLSVEDLERIDDKLLDEEAIYKENEMTLTTESPDVLY